MNLTLPAHAFPMEALGDFRKRFAIGVVQTGCAARREERRVASHTNDEQHRNAPVCAAKMVNPFPEIALTRVFSLECRTKMIIGHNQNEYLLGLSVALAVYPHAFSSIFHISKFLFCNVKYHGAKHCKFFSF